MNPGKVCCTVKDSMVETLERLLDKMQDMDYIRIECRYIHFGVYGCLADAA